MSCAFVSHRRAVFIAMIGVLAFGFGLTGPAIERAAACGGCPSAQDTLAEEIAQSAAAVICRLVARPNGANVAGGAAPTCTFEVTECLKGAGVLAAQPGAQAFAGKPQQIEILYAGEEPLGTVFYARGDAPQNLVWYPPTAIAPREIEYLRKLPALPKQGPARLKITFDYLEAPEPLLAADAYEEFARASYADVAATKADMPREKLLRWIADVNIQSAHRKQYLYMLAVCGTPDDVPKIEALLRSGDQATSRILDAVIGSYLVMRGAAGLPVIEQLFLQNPQAEYVDTYSAIMALRFTAVESKAIDRKRIDASLRLLLDRPQLADLVIPDLIRSRDWTISPQLAQLFRNAEATETLWVRVPIAEYFRLCPTTAAVELRKELETLDPKAFARATALYGEHGPATEDAGVPATQPAQ